MMADLIKKDIMRFHFIQCFKLSPRKIEKNNNKLKTWISIEINQILLDT